MMTFGSSGDCTGSRVKKKMETIDFSNRKITNIEEAGFGIRLDVLRKRKIFIHDDTRVTSRVNRCKSDIVW